MDIQELMRQLHTKSNSKIVMLVADGLGGLPLDSGRKDRIGDRPDTQSGPIGSARRAGGEYSGVAGDHARAVGPATWPCSATTR